MKYASFFKKHYDTYYKLKFFHGEYTGEISLNTIGIQPPKTMKEELLYELINTCKFSIISNSEAAEILLRRGK